jgi:hypothetical protein
MSRRWFTALTLAVAVAGGGAAVRSKRRALAAELATTRDLHGGVYAG